ncbi:MAG: DUF3143 domain-containing protein, partial [Cyanobacteria bacterium P01_C01_bin.69]
SPLPPPPAPLPTRAPLPPSSPPLYSHPRPAIDSWLTGLGATRDDKDLSQWRFSSTGWTAELRLEVDSIVVYYASSSGKAVQRSFKYSLSRADLEEVIFSGP